MKIPETEEGRQLIEPFLDSDKNGMSKTFIYNKVGHA